METIPTTNRIHPTSTADTTLDALDFLNQASEFLLLSAAAADATNTQTTPTPTATTTTPSTEDLIRAAAEAILADQAARSSAAAEASASEAAASAAAEAEDVANARSERICGIVWGSIFGALVLLAVGYNVWKRVVRRKRMGASSGGKDSDKEMGVGLMGV